MKWLFQMKYIHRARENEMAVKNMKSKNKKKEK
jgi:hypothetical protein